MEANRLENHINHSDEKSGNRNPIEFQETTLQSDMFDIALPPGYVVDELPPPFQAHCDYARYKSEVQVKDTVLHYTRTYEITDLVVPSEKLSGVRDFFHQVAAADQRRPSAHRHPLALRDEAHLGLRR